MAILKVGDLVRARQEFHAKVTNAETKRNIVYTVHQYAVLKIEHIYPGGNFLCSVPTDLIYHKFKVKGSLLIKNDTAMDLLYGFKDT